MAEDAITRRKSQVFLQTISPVKNTFDELVIKKLKGGKFPTTKTGVLKMMGMLVLLFSTSLFLAQPVCENTPKWYKYLLPISEIATILVQLALYLIFSLGCTIKRPAIWIYLDIGAVLLFSIQTVISSVITYTECSDRSMEYRIPGPSGMAGGIILIMSCGSLLMLYRYVEDKSSEPKPNENDESTEPRKSVYA